MKRQYEKYYFDNPEIWHALRSRTYKKEAEYLDKIFKQGNDIKRILDIGCGTGLHANYLSKLGYEVVGIDANESMVEYARSHYDSLEVHKAEMKNFSLQDAQFDGIYCLCTVFSYNTDNAEVFESLANFNAHLRPGGMMIIDNINPISLIASRGFKDQIIEHEPYSQYDLVSEANHRIINSRQVLEELRVIKQASTGKVLREDVTCFRLFFPKEFELYLNASGFEVLSQHSNFDIDDPDTQLNGYRMISVARKHD